MFESSIEEQERHLHTHPQIQCTRFGQQHLRWLQEKLYSQEIARLQKDMEIDGLLTTKGCRKEILLMMNDEFKLIGILVYLG